MKVTLFIPTLNEIEGSKVIIPRIDKSWIDEILVVDGGSTDGTVEWYRENGIKVIEQKKHMGLGGAYRECYENCIGDIIIPFSPDNNSIPEVIPKLIERIKSGDDMCIASRYLDDATSEDDDLITGFGNWMFTTMLNILYGGNYTDTLVMYRAVKKDLFRELSIDFNRPYVIDTQLNIRCLKYGKNVSSIPASEPKRIGGERKMRPLVNGSAILWQLIIEKFINY